MSSNCDAPLPVEIRLAGHLDQHWSAWFGNLALTHHADGTTTLRGTVTDQAQLYGVLAQIRDLGAALISLTPIHAGDDGGDERGGPGSQQPRQLPAAEATNVPPTSIGTRRPR